jgi:lipopolysaccharide transport system permease protein
LTTPNSAPLTVIEARSGWSVSAFAELWTSRELIGFLVMRDVLVKYKQAFLGIAWVVLQPLVMMAVFTVFFGVLIRIESPGMPYPLFAFTGLLPWTYFSSSVINGSTSLVANRLLISRVYFPRMALPTSSVLAALVDLVPSLVVLGGLMVAFDVMPTWRVLALLPLTILATCCAMGCSFWLSAINVRYRDVQYTIPVVIQIWFFVTPVIYPSSAVPAAYRPLFGANPMVAVVEGYRWALTSQPFPDLTMMVISCIISLLLLITGALYFQRAERLFADVV